ncbi:putative ribonuclease H-like domain-containing protein [Tanacetum coccineum]
MVPKAVLMRSGLVSLTTARPVNTAQPKSTVNSARPMTNVFNQSHSNCDAQGNMTGEHSIFTDFKKLMEDIVACGDDYSRFSWVFFLATKDETSGILKSFITRVENLIDQKVKVIRCDNETEFKNKEMNQFCERKGIKREFSVARIPQQNGVAKRKNRTLIKVLVTKPHNKTPYELFLGRKLALSFMKPFWCPVTILNTIDHLGKFDGKVDKGFFVGYSINSKAFRVFNSRTRIVEENLHVQFSENTPNIARSGPNWLFDIDALTKSMNYKPVVAGNQSNGNAGDDEKKVTEEPKKEGGDPRKDSEFNDQEKEDSDITTRDVFSQATLLHIEGMLFPLISPDYIPGFPGTSLNSESISTQIAKLQRKQMGNNNKIALARFRIANLEQIIEDIQARHQADKESLLNAIYELKKQAWIGTIELLESKILVIAFDRT